MARPRRSVRPAILASAACSGPVLLLAASGRPALAVAAAAWSALGCAALIVDARRRNRAEAADPGEAAVADLMDRVRAADPRLEAELRPFLDAPAEAGETAEVDPATGLLTREAFAERIQGLIDADPGARLAVAVFRLDDLDRVAAFDPAAADRVLAAFAARVERTSEPGAPIGRLEDACFGVGLSAAEDAAAAARRLRALCYVLRQEIVDGDLRFTPDLRVGAAIHPADGASAPDLLRRALTSAGAPGEEGGAGEEVAFFSPASRSAALERFTLKQELRNAIDREELALQYQPVVDLAAGRVAAAEALLRWRRPDGTQVAPSHFIPLLEETTLIEEIGLWTFNTACRQVRAWAEVGLTDLRVAVNLSARQLRDAQLPQTLARILDLHGVRPDQLEVELTETAAMQDEARSRALLGELRDLGVGIAIDDFGAGYSSLTYLKNLPFTKLKIDREFVSFVDGQHQSRAICKALIELSRGLGIAVLAEGTERLEEVETLFGLGCPLFQGFYFSRPLDPDVFAKKVVEPEWLEQLASPVHRRLDVLRRGLAGAAVKAAWPGAP